MSEIDLALVGAGPVGVAAAKTAARTGVGRVRWVVDPDEGRRYAAAAELEAVPCSSVDHLPHVESAVSVAAFTSRATVAAPVIERLIGLGYSVVTTCEELADPTSQVRERLEHVAGEAGRVVVATGANPGFVMDRLPLLLAAASSDVTAVRVRRRLDTRQRRGPLVAKTGRGLTPESFAADAARGAIGHVGLDASLRLVAAGMGWPTDPVVLSIEPVLDADGVVAGQHQVARLSTPRGVIEYELVMAATIDDSVDEVIVDGNPPVHAVLVGGYHGDSGTSARVGRALAAVPELRPGFYLPTDLPLWG